MPLDGSVRPATLLDLAREARIQMPKHTPEELGEFMRVDDARTLEDYLRRFDVTISVMQSEEALERIAYELAEDAAEDGVRYIEVRNAPILNVVQGLNLVQAVEAPLADAAGPRRLRNSTVNNLRMRPMTPEDSLEMAHLAVEFKNERRGSPSVVERRGTPPRRHVADLQLPRQHNPSCHAGEGQARIRAAKRDILAPIVRPRHAA